MKKPATPADAKKATKAKPVGNVLFEQHEIIRSHSYHLAVELKLNKPEYVKPAEPEPVQAEVAPPVKGKKK